MPLTKHIQGFPGKHYCPRMATMNKPAYAAIRTHSPSKPTLIFVSSRRQTRLTAQDLISYCVADQVGMGYGEREVLEKGKSVEKGQTAADGERKDATAPQTALARSAPPL